jgi:DNA-binding MarR family transcriptional regulator
MNSDSVVKTIDRIVFGGIAMTAAALEHATGGQEVTFTQWRAIRFIGNTPDGCHVSDVARRLMAALSTTSRLLRRLEDRGLVTTGRDEQDRRATRVRLTPEGMGLRSAVLAWRSEQISEVVRDLVVPEEAGQVLETIAARFEAHGREARPARTSTASKGRSGS